MAKLEYLKALYTILFAACAGLVTLTLVGGPVGAAGIAGDNIHLFKGRLLL